jgi:hypothetical protein
LNRRLPPSRKYEEEDFMKKLIAIAVVFALAAGAVFAADVGATVDGLINVVQGDNEENAEAMASGKMNNIRLQASGQNEEGTFGGWLRVDAINTELDQGTLTGHNWEKNAVRYFNAFGNVWWKPIEQLKFLIGGNPDGLFDTGIVSQWGFYQVAGDLTGEHGNAWGGGNEGGFIGPNYRDAFFGGWDKEGAVITLTPIDGLEVNLAIPFISELRDDINAVESPRRGEDVYKKMVVKAAYNIDGIGKFALTWDGRKYDFSGASGEAFGAWGWDADGDGKVDYQRKKLGQLYGYFELTSIENLSVELGLGLPFFQKSVYNNAIPGGDDAMVSPFEMYVGLGAGYSAGAFGVKARLLMGFGSYTSSDTDVLKNGQDAFKMMFDLMPYYAINDTLTAHLSFGMGFKGDSYSDGESRDDAPNFAAWHIYPYITVKGGWWAPNFYAGLKIKADGKSISTDADKAKVVWEVPVGIHFEF